MFTLNNNKENKKSWKEELNSINFVKGADNDDEDDENENENENNKEENNNNRRIKNLKSN